MRRVRAESDADFAKRAGVNYEWLKKWMKRDDAPNERINTDRIVALLGADRRWLLDNVGNPPRPELWREWIADTVPEHIAVAEAHGLTTEKGKDARAVLQIEKAPAKGANRRTGGSGKR